MVAVLPPLLPPQLYTKKIRCFTIRKSGAAKLAARINLNLSRSLWGAMCASQPSRVPFWQYAAAMLRWDGSMSRTRFSALPGKNRFPGCQPKVEVASAFGMRSIFSASNAPRNFTTCRAFSLVTVQPSRERSKIPRLEKTASRG